MRTHTTVLSVILLLPLSTFADPLTITTYTYTGQGFTTYATGQYTTDDHITGFFTVPTLGPNLVGADLTVDAYAYSFSDGVGTFTGPLPIGDMQHYPLGQVWTDANGNIDGWSIGVGFFREPRCSSRGGTAPGAARDYCDRGTLFSSAENDDAPGVWTQVTTPIPEPSSFILISTALLASACRARKWAA